MKWIYTTIFQMIQYNRENAELVLLNEHFYFLLHQNSNKYVKKVLTEAINESEIYNFELKDWMQFLQPLNHVFMNTDEQNRILAENEIEFIMQQRFVLKIMCSILRNGNKAIKERQNEVRKNMFKNKLDDQYLIRFDIHDGNPIVIFRTNYSEEEDKVFFLTFKSLYRMKRPRNDQLSFYLQDFQTNDPKVSDYAKYIANYIELLATMCEDRNEKNISICTENLKIDNNYLIHLLKDDQVGDMNMKNSQHLMGFDIYIKNSLRKLYMNSQLDINPMHRLTQMNSNSIIYDHIDQVSISKQTYTMIGQEFSDNLENNYKHILSNFNSFKSSIEHQWKHQISEIDLSQLNKNSFYEDDSEDAQKVK